MKKNFAIILLSTTSIFPCFGMELIHEHVSLPEIIHYKVHVFLGVVEKNLYTILCKHDSTYTLEIIGAYIHHTIASFITMALTIENLTTKNPIIKLYVLTQEAREKAKRPKNHWFYDALKKKTYTEEQLVLNKESFFWQANQKISFKYEDSTLFYDCTYLFQGLISSLEKILKENLTL